MFIIFLFLLLLLLLLLFLLFLRRLRLRLLLVLVLLLLLLVLLLLLLRLLIILLRLLLLLLFVFVFCFFAVSICLIVTYWGLLRPVLEICCVLFNLLQLSFSCPFSPSAAELAAAQTLTHPEPVRSRNKALRHGWQISGKFSINTLDQEPLYDISIYFGQKSCVDRTAVRRASKTKQGHGFTMVHFKIDTSPQTDIYITHAQAHSVALYTLRVLRCFTHSAPYLLPTSYKVRKIWTKNCSVKVFLTSLVKIPQKVCLKLVGQRMTKVGICRYHYGSDHSYGITDLVILEAALNMLCSVSRRV